MPLIANWRIDLTGYSIIILFVFLRFDFMIGEMKRHNLTIPCWFSVQKLLSYDLTSRWVRSDKGRSVFKRFDLRFRWLPIFSLLISHFRFIGSKEIRYFLMNNFFISILVGYKNRYVIEFIFEWQILGFNAGFLKMFFRRWNKNSLFEILAKFPLAVKAKSQSNMLI